LDQVIGIELLGTRNSELSTGYWEGERRGEARSPGARKVRMLAWTSTGIVDKFFFRVDALGEAIARFFAKTGTLVKAMAWIGRKCTGEICVDEIRSYI
jgi:hypothetical protein